MGKYFLIFGIIGAMFVNSVYAGDNQSVVVYTCPDGCVVNNDITNCIYPGGGDCGTFTADVFVSSGKTPIATSVLASPRNSSPVAARSATEPMARAATESVAARAAVGRLRAGAQAAGRLKGQDKAAGQEIQITCPDGCSVYCFPGPNDTMECNCKTADGRLCEERVVQNPNTIISF